MSGQVHLTEQIGKWLFVKRTIQQMKLFLFMIRQCQRKGGRDSGIGLMVAR